MWLYFVVLVAMRQSVRAGLEALAVGIGFQRFVPEVDSALAAAVAEEPHAQQCCLAEFPDDVAQALKLE